MGSELPWVTRTIQVFLLRDAPIASQQVQTASFGQRRFGIITVCLTILRTSASYTSRARNTSWTRKDYSPLYLTRHVRDLAYTLTHLLFPLVPVKVVVDDLAAATVVHCERAVSRSKKSRKNELKKDILASVDAGLRYSIAH